MFLLVHDNENNLETDVTKSTNEYEPTEETRTSLEINETKISNPKILENNISKISTASKKDEYNQFKFNIPGNSACDDSELKVELSRGLKNDNKKIFVCFAVLCKAK